MRIAAYSVAVTANSMVRAPTPKRITSTQTNIVCVKKKTSIENLRDGRTQGPPYDALMTF